MKKMPDFLIIGAPKAGTTALYFYLLQHPELFLPIIKEPFFFAFESEEREKLHHKSIIPAVENAVVNLDSYQALFDEAPEGSIKGEASTIYLASDIAPKKIHSYLPDIKLIAILRNPVERAYSQYLHFRRDQFEPCETFREAVEQESTRIGQNWFQSFFYIQSGFYAKQLKKYFQYFDKSRIRLFLYEDMSNPQTLVTQIFEFLNVSADYKVETSTKHNRSGKVRIPGLYKTVSQSQNIKPFLRKMVPVNQWGKLRSFWERLMISSPTELSNSIRSDLIDVYRNDILELQDILNRDLSMWLKRSNEQ